jgi:hypothetical protein
MFMIVNSTLAAFSFFLFALLTLWRIIGDFFLPVGILVIVARAASLTALLYLSFLGLQHPADVQWRPFAIVIFLSLLSSTIELFGIRDFSDRTRGSWFFGYGFVPCLDFIVVLFSTAALLACSIWFRSADVENSAKRSRLLILLGTDLTVFFVLSFAQCLARWNLTIWETRGFEWVAMVLTPLFLTSLLLINGWFWWDFNPGGWKALDSKGGQKPDMGGSIFEDGSDSGPIPSLETKKKSKKGKSDDPFDELSDPGSDEPVKFD